MCKASLGWFIWHTSIQLNSTKITRKQYTPITLRTKSSFKEQVKKGFCALTAHKA